MRGEVSHRSEVSEIKNPGNQSFEDIKPKSDITVDDARAFFDNLFQQLEKAERVAQSKAARLEARDAAKSAKAARAYEKNNRNH